MNERRRSLSVPEDHTPKTPKIGEPQEQTTLKAYLSLVLAWCWAQIAYVKEHSKLSLTLVFGSLLLSRWLQPMFSPSTNDLYWLKIDATQAQMAAEQAKMEFYKSGFLKHLNLLNETFHGISPSQPVLDQELSNGRDQAADFGFELLSATWGPKWFKNSAMLDQAEHHNYRILLRDRDFETYHKQKFDQWETTAKELAKDAIERTNSVNEICRYITEHVPT